MQLVSICDVRIIFQVQYILSNFKFQHSVGFLILHFTPLPPPSSLSSSSTLIPQPRLESVFSLLGKGKKELFLKNCFGDEVA